MSATSNVWPRIPGGEMTVTEDGRVGVMGIDRNGALSCIVMSFPVQRESTGIHVQQINRYEAGCSEPSAEALRKIARTFAISTDWLLFEDGECALSGDLALQFKAAQLFSDEERAVIREVVDSLIMKYQSRRWNLAGPVAFAAKRTAAAGHRQSR
jgi:transcriptional regulator with XRE-family HTH domain